MIKKKLPTTENVVPARVPVYEPNIKLHLLDNHDELSDLKLLEALRSPSTNLN